MRPRQVAALLGTALGLAFLPSALAGPPIGTAVDEGNEQCGPASAARGAWSLYGTGTGFASIAELYGFLQKEMGTTDKGTDFAGFVTGKMALHLKIATLQGAPGDGTSNGLTTSGFALWGSASFSLPGFETPIDDEDNAKALATIKSALGDPNTVVEIVVAFRGASREFASPHCLNVTGVVESPEGKFVGFTGVQDPKQGDGVAALETVSPGSEEQSVVGPFDTDFGPERVPERMRVGWHVMYVFIEKKERYRDGKPVTTAGGIQDGGHGTPADTRATAPAAPPSRPGRWSPSQRW